MSIRLKKLSLTGSVQAPGQAVPGSGQSRAWFTDDYYSLELIGASREEPAHFLIRKDDQELRVPYEKSNGHVVWVPPPKEEEKSA